MHSIRHISESKSLDYFTEPMVGDMRLVGMLVGFVFLGIVASTFIELNPEANRSTTTNMRIIRGGGSRITAMRYKPAA